MLSRRLFGALFAAVLVKLGIGVKSIDARTLNREDVNRIANEYLKKNGIPPSTLRQLTAKEFLIGEYLDHISLHAEQLGVTESPEIYLKNYAAMPMPMQNLAVCNLLLGQVINGGFGQFYYNTDGVTAPEVIIGFRATGEEELAQIVEESMKFFASGMARDRASRQAQLLEGEDPQKAFMGARAAAFFEPLNTRFYEHVGTVGDAYMLRIIQRYPDLLN